MHIFIWRLLSFFEPVQRHTQVLKSIYAAGRPQKISCHLQKSANALFITFIYYNYILKCTTTFHYEYLYLLCFFLQYNDMYQYPKHLTHNYCLPFIIYNQVIMYALCLNYVVLHLETHTPGTFNCTLNTGPH